MTELRQTAVLNRVAALCEADAITLTKSDALTHSGKIGYAAKSTSNLARKVLESEGLTAARNLILASLLTQTTRNKISAMSSDLVVSEKDVREFCFSVCQESPEQAGLNFQDDMNGVTFFHQTLADESKSIKSSFEDVTDYRVKNLCLKFAHLSPHIKPLVYLLYSMMQQDPHQRIETIKYWLKSFEQKPENMQLLQNFLGVFGDITQYVHDASGSSEVINRSRLVLAGVLEDRRLADSDHFNPFEVLKEYLSEPGVINPWIIAERDDSPFDAYSIGDLLDPEVPRKLLAMSAAGLNWL